jgi:hypothetical protein
MRTRLGWIAMLILDLTALVAAVQAQPAPVPPPCVPVDGCLQANEWYTYRYNNARTGAQPYASDLSDPTKVGRLRKLPVWQFPPTEEGIAGGFKASPIVVHDTVFIGGEDGKFYALNAADGTLDIIGFNQSGSNSAHRTWGTGADN